MKREEEKFLKKGLDGMLAKQPDRQIGWALFPSPLVGEGA